MRVALCAIELKFQLTSKGISPLLAVFLSDGLHCNVRNFAPVMDSLKMWKAPRPCWCLLGVYLVFVYLKSSIHKCAYLALELDFFACFI